MRTNEFWGPVRSGYGALSCVKSTNPEGRGVATASSPVSMLLPLPVPPCKSERQQDRRDRNYVAVECQRGVETAGRVIGLDLGKLISIGSGRNPARIAPGRSRKLVDRDRDGREEQQREKADRPSAQARKRPLQRIPPMLPLPPTIPFAFPPW
jgi:hypothetical protein